MICPQCDAILAAGGCQACGWRHGDPFPRARAIPPHLGGTFPFRPGGEYPIDPERASSPPSSTEIPTAQVAEPAPVPEPVGADEEIPPAALVQAEVPPLLPGHVACSECGLGVARDDFDSHFLTHMRVESD